MTADWETPQYLFDELNREFHFTLDVCATEENAKCTRFLSPEDDGLWHCWYRAICWMNPPYGRGIDAWIRKAHDEVEYRRATVVGLLPARTDAKWFHDYVWHQAEIRFIKGRLEFRGTGWEKRNRPRFASMIVIWRPMTLSKEIAG
jgi:site-specific DNA-methyltransferase (adenine-specific)